MASFLEAANGKYTFDCICAHWYGGSGNTLEQDQDMIAAQMKEYASLASQHGISDIVLAEMGRLNGDKEVRSLPTISPPMIVFGCDFPYVCAMTVADDLWRFLF